MTDLETPAPRTRNYWRLTFGQIRLGLLMTALALGITGMMRNDPRIVNVAIIIGMVGVILGLVRRFIARNSTPPE